MKTRVLLVMAVRLLVGAQAQDDVKKEMAKFKGTWSMVSFAVPKGVEGPSEKEIKESKFIFGQGGEDKVVVTVGKVEDKSSFKLDLTKNPKQIEIINQRGTLFKCLYQLDGDTLLFCVTENGDEYPKEFKVDNEKKTGIMTLKRDRK